MKNILFLGLLMSSCIFGIEDSEVVVKITDDISYVDVLESGKKIRVERIQDTQNRLTDDFVKTSRRCPPHCIVPITPDPNIVNFEELEVLKFMKNDVFKKKGLLVDAREPPYYRIETIPTAVNIPYSILETGNKKTYDYLYRILGVRNKSDGTEDFSNAKKLVIFCSGLWCQASSRAIMKLIEHGYPKRKIAFYRSGLQGWKLLGLTTTIREERTK